MLPEKYTYRLLWLYTGVSILTGYIGYFDPNPVIPPSPTLFDRLYFIGAQLAEILLLYTLYSAITSKRTRKLLLGLLFLALSEMIDEVLGRNMSFRFNDGVLLLITLYIVYNTIKKIKNGQDNHLGRNTDRA